MKVLVTAATENEWKETYRAIHYGDHPMKGKVHFHTSGVGIPSSLFSISQVIDQEKPSLIIQAGIAGCFDILENVNQTYVIKNDVFADVGVEENDEWMDLFDMGFMEKNTFPYTGNLFENPWLQKYNLLKLPAVAAITINEITTRNERRNQFIKKYNPFLESMEGASLHYACLMKSVPFIQMRTISNMVGERDKKKWQLKSAIEQLNDTLIKYLDTLL